VHSEAKWLNLGAKFGFWAAFVYCAILFCQAFGLLSAISVLLHESFSESGFLYNLTKMHEIPENFYNIFAATLSSISYILFALSAYFLSKHYGSKILCIVSILFPIFLSIYMGIYISNLEINLTNLINLSFITTILLIIYYHSKSKIFLISAIILIFSFGRFFVEIRLEHIHNYPVFGEFMAQELTKNIFYHARILWTFIALFAYHFLNNKPKFEYDIDKHMCAALVSGTLFFIFMCMAFSPVAKGSELAYAFFADLSLLIASINLILSTHNTKNRTTDMLCLLGFSLPLLMSFSVFIDALSYYPFTDTPQKIKDFGELGLMIAIGIFFLTRILLIPIIVVIGRICRMQIPILMCTMFFMLPLFGAFFLSINCTKNSTNDMESKGLKKLFSSFRNDNLVRINFIDQRLNYIKIIVLLAISIALLNLSFIVSAEFLDARTLMRWAKIARQPFGASMIPLFFVILYIAKVSQNLRFYLYAFGLLISTWLCAYAWLRGFDTLIFVAGGLVLSFNILIYMVVIVNLILKPFKKTSEFERIENGKNVVRSL